MFAIRPFEKTAADYAIIAAIDAAAVFAEYPRSIAEWRHFDATYDPDKLFCREMIERDGKVIAVGEYGQLRFAADPHIYSFFALVSPDQEPAAVLQMYFERVMGILAPHNPRIITVAMLADKKAYIDFFLRQGFQEVLREIVSQVDLAAFEETKFADTLDEVRAAGIRIITLPELREIDPNWQRALWEANWQLSQDVPIANPEQRESLAEFVKRRLGDPGFMPEGHFFALDGEQCVGLAMLDRMDAKKDTLFAAFTGVARSHRRRGIAAALKVRSMSFAKQCGVRFIETNNEVNNPMYDLNLALGFRPKNAWVELERVLRADANKKLKGESMFTIRPFEDTAVDYESVRAIHAAVFAEFPRTVAEWRHNDASRSQEHLFRREMIELDGEVIAFGEYGQSQHSYSFHPQKYNFFVLVHPEHEHPNMRQVYFDHVMNILASYAPIAVTSWTLENDKTQSHVEFLLRQGFKEMFREAILWLDLATFDETKFAGIHEKMRGAAIRIVSLAELREIDPDWRPKLWELECQLFQDVPNPNPSQTPTLEEFTRRRFDDPGFMPEGYFVALQGASYVGQTSLWIAEARKDTLSTGLTGVVRSHRRKGIATALKLQALEFARQRGIRYVETSNERDNPMYDLNLALGFQPQNAWVEFEKVLREDADAS